MPEYLAPGVYVEEVSFRSKSIEGVATSTTGFAGMAQFGPVQYPGGPKTTEPRLVGSLVEYESIYGGLESINTGPTGSDERLTYMAHATRAFFENGGQRLYISRVFVPRGNPPAGPFDWGVAHLDIAVSTGFAHWRARWPGAYGNVVVETSVVRSKNIAYQSTAFGAAVTQVTRAKNGAVVEIYDGVTPPVGDAALDITKVAVLQDDGTNPQTFIGQGGAVVPSATAVIQLVELSVAVTVTPERLDVYNELGADPTQKRYIAKILQADNPEDENSVVWLDWDPTSIPADPFLPARLMIALQGSTSTRLAGGHDGLLVMPDDLAGTAADPDDADIKATGLEALGEVEDIAIIALPDGGTYDDVTLCAQAADRLITKEERK